MTRTLIARSRWALPLAVAALAALLLLTHVSGAPAASTKTVNVTLSDFKIKTSKPSVAAGKVTFVVKNAASMEHEMVVIKTNTKAAKLPVHGGMASEKGSVGEADDIGGGKTKKLTLTLKKGHYALICNVPGHYAAGMHADFTVN